MRRIKQWIAAFTLVACVAGLSLGLSWVSDSVLASQLSPLPLARAEENTNDVGPTPQPTLSPTSEPTLVPVPPTPIVPQAEALPLEPTAMPTDPSADEAQTEQAQVTAVSEEAFSSLSDELQHAIGNPQKGYLLSDELVLNYGDYRLPATLYSCGASQTATDGGQSTVSHEQFASVRERLEQTFYAATGITPPASFACQIAVDIQDGTWSVNWKPSDYALAEIASIAGVPQYQMNLSGRKLVQCAVAGRALEVGAEVEALVADQLNGGRTDSTTDVYAIDRICSQGDGWLVCETAGRGSARFAYTDFDATNLRIALERAAVALLRCLDGEHFDIFAAFLYADGGEQAVSPEMLDASRFIYTLINSKFEYSDGAARLLMDQIYLEDSYAYLYLEELAVRNQCPLSKADMDHARQAASALFEALMGITPGQTDYVTQITLSGHQKRVHISWRPADKHLRSDSPVEYGMTLYLEEGNCNAYVDGLALPATQFASGRADQQSLTTELQERWATSWENVAVRRMFTHSDSRIMHLIIAPLELPFDQLYEEAAHLDYQAVQPNFDVKAFETALAAAQEYFLALLSGEME